MRAFLLSMVLLVVVTAAAAFGLNSVPMAAKDVFIEKNNVRL